MIERVNTCPAANSARVKWEARHVVSWEGRQVSEPAQNQAKRLRIAQRVKVIENWRARRAVQGTLRLENGYRLRDCRQKGK